MVERMTAGAYENSSVIEWAKKHPVKVALLGGIAVFAETVPLDCGDSTAHPVVPEYLSVEETVDQPDLSSDTTTFEVDGIEYTAAMPR